MKKILICFLLFAVSLSSHAAPNTGITIIPNPDPAGGYVDQFRLYCAPGEAAIFTQCGTVGTANVTATILFSETTAPQGLNVFKASAWNALGESALSTAFVICYRVGDEGFCDNALPPGQLIPKKKN